jgi:hypothetical protein
MESGHSLMFVHSSQNSTLSLNNFYVHDVGLSGGISMLMIGNIANAQIQNLTFENVNPSDPTDTTNYLIDFDEVSPTFDSVYTVSDVNMNMCSVSLFTMRTSEVASTVGIQLTMSDVTVQNLNYPFDDDIIVFSNILSDALIQITLDNMNFDNIIFERGGNLMVLRNQQDQNLEITNSQFSNIQNAGITLQAFDATETTKRTNVLMDNITATQVNAQDTWFISAYEGADLKIQNSIFNKISNLRTGAVIYAGYQRATVQISDSTFVNNTSIEGAVMNAESSSKIT